MKKAKSRQPEKKSLSDSVLAAIKDDLFSFRLMPGQRFSENELALRMGVSRTPVREALYKLEREGYIQVLSRSGWSVREFNFEYFENLYDVRVVLELAAVRRLCEMESPPPLDELREAWLVPVEARLADSVEVGKMDERFHEVLVSAAGNPEMARIYHDVTERIRIIRRLEFSMPERIRQTYSEHAQILRAVLKRKKDTATLLLRSHIEMAKAEVRKITLHRLHTVHQVAVGT
jgi:DNA-binding GntR family transcriptional regulator